MAQGNTQTLRTTNTYAMAVTALMTAVTCILAPLSIPIGPVPISLTNFAIYLSLYLLDWKKGTVSYILYLLLGLVGLPVFSGFTGGIGKLAGPTGGYIIGFIPMAIIGVTAAKVTDIITGRRIPIKRPIPIHCNNVTIPQQKRSELISIAIASFERPSRSPIISGTATAPAYMTRTCCRPSMISFPGDNMRSTSSVGRSCPEDEEI